MRWFRFYAEALHDPKILKLTDKEFRAWVLMLCIAAENDGKIATEDLGIQLRMSGTKADNLFDALVEKGLFSGRSAEGAEPHNWNGRQYTSDVSTPRVKRFRERLHAVTETPPDTDTETESEQTQKQSRPEQSREDAAAAAFARFGAVTSGTVDAIGYAVKDYGIDWVERAVRSAAASGFEGRPPWSYVDSILERWKEQKGPDDEQPRIQPARQFARSGVIDTSANAADRAEARLRALDA